MSLAHKQKIGQLLLNDGWKEVMGLIPSSKNPQLPRFTTQDITAIEEAAIMQNLTGMEALMEEWGTMGKSRRPNVFDLMRLCLETHQVAAASYINDQILGRGPICFEQVSEVISSLEETTTVARESEFESSENFEGIDALLEDEAGLLPEENSDFLTIPVAPENTLGVPNIPFSYLERISSGFSRQIGEGGFSVVYLGITKRSMKKIAIKKLKLLDNLTHDNKMIEQLNNEVDQLPRLKHPNIIDLIGYSNDNSGSPCLLYPFMENGTLDKKLTFKTASTALNVAQRLTIVVGVARGINHLHTFYIDEGGKRKPLIHRDIKPSNILLDNDFQPKIADFGLLRYGASGESQTMTQTLQVRGTPAYLSPEAARGDVSEKMDVWAYGVLLIEILSGLPVIDKARSDMDLASYAMAAFEDGDLGSLVDENVDWPDTVGSELLQIAKSCLKAGKASRPSMAQILDSLKAVAILKID